AQREIVRAIRAHKERRMATPSKEKADWDGCAGCAKSVVGLIQFLQQAGERWPRTVVRPAEEPSISYSNISQDFAKAKNFPGITDLCKEVCEGIFQDEFRVREASGTGGPTVKLAQVWCAD